MRVLERERESLQLLLRHEMEIAPIAQKTSPCRLQRPVVGTSQCFFGEALAGDVAVAATAAGTVEDVPVAGPVGPTAAGVVGGFMTAGAVAGTTVFGFATAGA